MKFTVAREDRIPAPGREGGSSVLGKTEVGTDKGSCGPQREVTLSK